MENVWRNLSINRISVIRAPRENSVVNGISQVIIWLFAQPWAVMSFARIAHIVQQGNRRPTLAAHPARIALQGCTPHCPANRLVKNVLSVCFSPSREKMHAHGVQSGRPRARRLLPAPPHAKNAMSTSGKTDREDACLAPNERTNPKWVRRNASCKRPQAHLAFSASLQRLRTLPGT